MYACVCLDEHISMCKEICVCILACACNLLAACCMYHCTTLCDCFFQESKCSPLTVVPTEASTHLWQVGRTSSPQIRLPRTGWEVTICSLTMTTSLHTAMHLNFTSPPLTLNANITDPASTFTLAKVAIFTAAFFLFFKFFSFYWFCFYPPSILLFSKILWVKSLHRSYLLVYLLMIWPNWPHFTYLFLLKFLKMLRWGRAYRVVCFFFFSYNQTQYLLVNLWQPKFLSFPWKKYYDTCGLLMLPFILFSKLSNFLILSKFLSYKHFS